MSNDSVIQVNNLVKYFDGRCVLDGIDFEVPKGCIYGLLGRNGAGKTTIIRILLGLEFPTRGETKLLGRRSDELSSSDRGRIGYVAEGHNLIQHYSVAYLVGLCKKISKKWDQKFFDHLIGEFNLPMDRKVKELSTGMRAQLSLSLAMAIDPELLVLDDPSLGLDTVARRQFLELAIEVIQRNGRTILFSSHILSDVERIADRIGILVDGKLAVDCPLEDLKQRVKKFQVVFEDEAPPAMPITEIICQESNGRELIFTAANWNAEKQKMLEAWPIVSCNEVTMSLEDIFIECTNPRSIVMTKEGS